MFHVPVVPILQAYTRNLESEQVFTLQKSSVKGCYLSKYSKSLWVHSFGINQALLIFKSVFNGALWHSYNPLICIIREQFDYDPS